MLTTALLSKLLAEFFLCDGGKLEESEEYNYFFVVFNVLKSALVCDLLSNESQFVGQL